ncbi:hypothetical protein [Motilimonas sp. E26]|nr:hypothetical protein [Motilimonas sp. E26]
MADEKWGQQGVSQVLQVSGKRTFFPIAMATDPIKAPIKRCTV